ncbi:MAG: DedA family protein, partial [Actinobacteria bacterium]|nr:DedA family protein [Actinomycetota bacterium]
LTDISTSQWFYLIIFSVALLDSVVPIVPSESMVIVGGVAAGLGDLEIPLVIVVAAIGAFLGDNMSYIIGRRASGFIDRRYRRTEKGANRLDWAHNQLEDRGGPLLITARFIPGGRTLLTLTCGVTHQNQRWFAKWVGIAAVIWASYASLLGFIGGKTFKDNHAMAFGVAFAMALAATGTIELVRHFRNRK